jgi:hypothetical protein
MPPLLRHRRRVGLAEAQRQRAVLQAEDEHNRELQPLGGVQGQERDPVGARIPEIRLGRQRRRGQEGRAILSVLPGRDQRQALQCGGGRGPGWSPANAWNGRADRRESASRPCVAAPADRHAD